MRPTPFFAVLLAGCSSLDTGPDSVPLETDPPGATVRLRGGGRIRTMPGTTPMTLELLRNLPDPIEIEFALQGYRPTTRKVFMQRRSGPEVLPRDEWKWPTEPIRVTLVKDSLSP